MALEAGAVGGGEAVGEGEGGGAESFGGEGRHGCEEGSEGVVE